MTYRSTFAAGAAAALLAALCASLAGASALKTAEATVQGGVIHVHGKPFFPVMLIDQCSSDATRRARKLGINVVLNEHCDGVSAQRQLTMMRQHPLAVLDAASSKVRGAGLAGWTYPDEPENNQWTPARLHSTFSMRRSSPDGLLSFVTTGGGFFRAPYRDERVDPDTYRKFARMADVAGFDLYPLGHCQQDVSSVYDAQREFTEIAGRTPTFQWIETGPIKPEYCGGFTMSPQELKAEVWLAIAGGARGIGFFTHTWSPEHKSFDVTPSIQHAIAQTSNLISAVRPGLLGKAMPSSANSGAIRVLARHAGHFTYVFAVNTARDPIVALVGATRLHHAPIKVFGERRSIQVNESKFIDSFRPLAVHVYVQRD